MEIGVGHLGRSEGKYDQIQYMHVWKYHKEQSYL